MRLLSHPVNRDLRTVVETAAEKTQDKPAAKKEEEQPPAVETSVDVAACSARLAQGCDSGRSGRNCCRRCPNTLVAATTLDQQPAKMPQAWTQLPSLLQPICSQEPSGNQESAAGEAKPSETNREADEKSEESQDVP